ncbi:MAG: type II toxin-antitoxin system RelE family toxin [Thermodesulfobacteriota bacterium]
MKLHYTKTFSKDLDGIAHDQKLKNRLLQVLEEIRRSGSLADMKNVRKIQGYEEYFRLRVGDYRLGMKKTKEGVEMLRLLHRKDIYKKFP